MTTLYLTRPGSTVRKTGEALKVYIPADEEHEEAARKVTLPLHKITQVVVAGNITLTTPVLQTLLQRNVGVTYLTSHGRFLGRLGPPLSKNGRLRMAQHEAHHDPVRRMELARACVAGKLRNQRVLLMRYQRKLEKSALQDAIDILERCEQNAQAVEPDLQPPPDPSRPQAESTWGTLLGYEGTGGAAYFRVFGQLLREGWDFPGRKRRPPTDPVNALLSFAYTLLYHQTLSAVQTVGLDPYVGFLHGSQYGKPALALDLMEELRPVIADSVVLTLTNKRILDHEDFEEELGAYRLTDSGRRAFYRQWEKRLDTEIRHPTFGYTVTYRRALVLQARLVVRWLQDEIPAYPPFTVR
jgi:CRISPR-associated protein Cas1